MPVLLASSPHYSRNPRKSSSGKEKKKTKPTVTQVGRKQTTSFQITENPNAMREHLELTNELKRAKSMRSIPKIIVFLRT